jgi:uncharacterized protein YbjT (DUF2867 family)
MKVFVTGASRYIGGSIAARLIAAGHTVTGLAHSTATARKIEALGIEPVVGSLDDTRVLAASAERADAVVNAADSDHRGASSATTLDPLVWSRALPELRSAPISASTALSCALRCRPNDGKCARTHAWVCGLLERVSTLLQLDVAAKNLGSVGH